MHPLWYGTTVAEFDRELDMAVEAGADTVRIDISWSSLQTSGEGEFSDWYVEKADTFFEHAEQRGLEVIATFWSAPCWASAAPESLRQGCEGDWWERDVAEYPAADPRDYARAAEWVVNRWGEHFRALELWNEPNLDYFLRGPNPTAEYARMVKTTYPRIKAIAPDLTVLAGALAASDGDFLTALYDHGISGHYDAISYHPYNEWRDPNDRWMPKYRAYAFQPGTEWMREIMVAHGDRDVDLWATELGFSTCTLGSSKRCVTESQQAEYTYENYRIARDWPFVKAMITYSMRDTRETPEDAESQFGLLRRDFTPKPAYWQFKRALSG